MTLRFISSLRTKFPTEFNVEKVDYETHLLNYHSRREQALDENETRKFAGLGKFG